MRARLVVGGSVTAVAATVAVVGVVSDGEPAAPAGGGSRSTGSFEPIATSPLGPRAGAVGVWTGTELVVAGGTTTPPCPPNADCAYGPGYGDVLADAAAYDPGTDTWRELAEAPTSFAGGYALWTGDEMLVVSDRLTLSYDPAANSWQRLDDVPDAVYGGGLVATDDGPVRFSYQQRPRHDEVTDWRLDPATGEWEALPADPFAESYDRSMAWHDGRLWLLSMDVEHHFEAHEGAPSRIAVLDGDEWTVVDEETPDLVYEQRVVAMGDHLIVPTSSWSGSGETQVLDPASGEWTSIPSAAEQTGCRLGHPLAGPSWVAGGRGLVAPATGDALAVPPCRGLEEPAVVAWAGERLVVWGGIGAGYKDNSAAGLVWTPAVPR